jgi:hypothetical protein
MKHTKGGNYFNIAISIAATTISFARRHSTRSQGRNNSRKSSPLRRRCTCRTEMVSRLGQWNVCPTQCDCSSRPVIYGGQQPAALLSLVPRHKFRNGRGFHKTTSRELASPTGEGDLFWSRCDGQEVEGLTSRVRAECVAHFLPFSRYVIIPKPRSPRFRDQSLCGVCSKWRPRDGRALPLFKAIDILGIGGILPGFCQFLEGTLMLNASCKRRLQNAPARWR